MRHSFRILTAAIALLGSTTTMAAAQKIVPRPPLEMRVVKSPTCGCCTAWISYMQKAGFKVTVDNQAEFTRLKRSYGVTAELESCHTAFVDGYVIEGHVPADLVKKLLAEKPAGIKGLAAPGMPAASPGMDMGHEKYTIYSFDGEGHVKRYAVR